jgi:hypothetical protein
VPNSPAFVDASSNPMVNNSQNLGKGLVFPRVDLSNFTLPALTGGYGKNTNFPTFLDGMIVYNKNTGGTAGVGSTEGTLTPGYWYYENKSGTESGGTWKPLSSGSSVGSALTGSASIVIDGDSIMRAALTGDVTAVANSNATVIATGAVNTAKLADNSVTSAKIVDATIATADLADNAVATAKINGAAVTQDKLADGAVNSAKIADGTITNADIANSTIQGGNLVPDIALAGSPTTTTQAAGTNNTTIATTAFVQAAAAASGDQTSTGGSGACTWYKVNANTAFPAHTYASNAWLVHFSVDGSKSSGATWVNVMGTMTDCQLGRANQCNSRRAACVLIF